MQRKKYMHLSFFRHIFTWHLKIPITPIKSTIYGFFFLPLPYVPINCWGGDIHAEFWPSVIYIKI